MKKKLGMGLALLLVLCLLSGCAYLPMLGMTGMRQGVATQGTTEQAKVNDDGTVTISQAQYDRYRQFDQLLDLMGIVNENYYEEVDPDAMLEGAAAGLLAGLGDPYTFYYTPEDYAKLWEDDEGEYAGIGIQISGNYLTGICTVSRVFSGTPAEEAGVHKGDVLYRVGEDMYVSAATLNDAVDVMRGEPGTPVDVTFMRNGEEITFTINRAKVNVNWVESGMLMDDVGYIILYEFSGDCSSRFSEAVDSLMAKGAKGLIIDLRDNPGGWVEDAKNIADIFLDKGIVCTARYKSGAEQSYRTTDGKIDVPLVILMNENSASSSEILAACLKERAGATVVGVQSFGKGIIQAVLPLEEGAGMQVTVAQYFTPEGNAMHKIGITPDVEVSLDKGDNGMHEFGDLADAQLKKALDVMEQKIAK